MYGTQHLSPQYKYHMPKLSASMETLDIAWHCPHALVPSPWERYANIYPLKWQMFLLPPLWENSFLCLLTIGGLSVSSPSFWINDLRASWNLLSRAGERVLTSPKIMWLCRKSLRKEKRWTHTPMALGVPWEQPPLCSHLDTPRGRPFSSVAIENKGLTLE